MFNRLVAESFTVLSMKSRHFQVASRFADPHGLGVRAGDALHLAAASDHGAILHTLDARLAEAGPAIGVATRLFA